MIPINQTKLPDFENRGNSMQACFASFFDVKLNEMAEVQNLTKDKVKEALEEYGYEIDITRNDPFNSKYIESGFYIAFGELEQKEDFDHYVIMKEGEVFHNPHPKGLDITKVVGYIYFEKLFDVLPEKEEKKVEEKTESKEELGIEYEIKSEKNPFIDEKILDKLGFVFQKKDPYTGRALFKLTLIRDPMADIWISAERMSAMIDHPDKDAWIFVYNELGKGNSRMSKKLHFLNQAKKFVDFYKWMNNIDQV